MDKEFLAKDVSNLDAIIRSIETDYCVYKWFLFLLNSPEAKGHVAQLTGTQSHYSNIYAMSFLQIIFYIIFTFSAFYIFFVQQYYFLVVLLILSFLGWGLHCLKKKHLVKLAAQFLSEDLGESEIGHTTLYQLSESYSKKFSTVSLVDIVYASEAAMRATLKISYVVTLCILTINIWIALLVIPLSMALVFFFLNTDFNYKRLASVRT